MEMLVTPAWLRKKIKTEPDIDFEVGISVHLFNSIGMFLPPDVVEDSAANDQHIIELKVAFGLVIRQLRMRDGFTIEKLADKASVLVEDIVAIERDPHFELGPRAVVKLAKVFKIPTPRFMKLSGLACAVDHTVSEEAQRFVAKSEGVSSLTRTQRLELNKFVKFLSEAE